MGPAPSVGSRPTTHCGGSGLTSARWSSRCSSWLQSRGCRLVSCVNIGTTRAVERQMEYTTLGRTGLKVSVAGLGCGGFSRLGLGTGKSEAAAIALVHEAFSLGLNLFDTAAVYGTEAVLGRALKTMPRDAVVSTTKAWRPRGGGRGAP